MATLNLTVPEEVKARAEAQAAERGFQTIDAYVASLVDADRAVPMSAELEQEILAGLATPAKEMTSADWDEMRRRFRESRSATGKP
jgi:hypothetical protein